MKIIKQGDLSKLKKIKRFECLTCGCIFEAEAPEYQWYSGQYNEDCYSCECPCCHVPTSYVILER